MIEPDIPQDENGFMTVWRGYGKEIYDSVRQSEARRHYLIMCDQFEIDPQAPPMWADADAGLNAVQTAAAKPHYFIPLARQSDQDLVVMSQPLALYAFHEWLSDRLRQRADRRFNAGDVAGAWHDLLTSMRLFRRVTVHQAWITELGEKESESLLTPVAQIISTLPKWTPQQLEHALRDLETLPDWQERQTMLKTMQFAMLDTLSVTNDFPGLGTRLGAEIPEDEQMMLHVAQHVGIDWNLFAKELNDEMQTYGELLEKVSRDQLEEQFNQLRLRLMGVPFRMPIRMSNQEEWQAFTVEWQAFAEVLQKRTAEFPFLTPGRSKLFGAMMGHMGTLAAGEMYRLQLMEESRSQALRLALALEQFRREHNQYPDSLEELRLPPMAWDMHMQYEKLGEGYRIQNTVFEMSVH